MRQEGSSYEVRAATSAILANDVKDVEGVEAKRASSWVVWGEKLRRGCAAAATMKKIAQLVGARDCRGIGAQQLC